MNFKKLYLAALGVSAFLSGAIGQYFYPGSIQPPSDIPFLIIGTLLIFAWYRADSDQFNYRRSVGLSVAVVALGIVALPYYLFRSRGVKRGFIAVGLFLLAALGYWLFCVAGQYSTYYAFQR